MKAQIFPLAAVVLLLAGCTSTRETMGTAQQITFNDLPAVAQDAVRNEIGNQPIARIDEETKYGQPTYRIEVQKPGVNPSLWVSSDGSIIKESRSLAKAKEQTNQEINEAAGAEAPVANPAPGVPNPPAQNPPNAGSGMGVHSGQDF